MLSKLFLFKNTSTSAPEAPKSLEITDQLTPTESKQSESEQWDNLSRFFCLSPSTTPDGSVLLYYLTAYDDYFKWGKSRQSIFLNYKYQMRECSATALHLYDFLRINKLLDDERYEKLFERILLLWINHKMPYNPLHINVERQLGIMVKPNPIGLTNLQLTAIIKVWHFQGTIPHTTVELIQSIQDMGKIQLLAICHSPTDIFGIVSHINPADVASIKNDWQIIIFSKLLQYGVRLALAINTVKAIENNGIWSCAFMDDARKFKANDFKRFVKLLTDHPESNPYKILRHIEQENADIPALPRAKPR